MRENYFNIVVNKLRNYKWKIINIQKIKNIVHSILDDKFSDAKSYKTIYYLKSKWHILSIKKDILLVKNPETIYNDDEIITMYYRPTLKTHCKQSLWTNRYIWWLKALELNVQNFSIHDEIMIYNNEKNSTEIALLDKKIIFKTYNNNNKSLRSMAHKHTQKIQISDQSFKYANLELSLLESLYSPSLLNKSYIDELCKQILRKQKWKLNIDCIEQILTSWKHHSSCNRLFQLAKWIHPQLADQLKNALKKHSFIMAK